MTETRLFTIPGTRSFLGTLAAAVIDGEIFPVFGPPALDPRADPLALAAVTILVPNRRAARALAEHFFRLSGKDSVILPRIRPIGDIESEEDFDLADEIELPPAMPALERQLAMARLIRGWTAALDPQPAGPVLVPSSPADAVYLAKDLLALIDLVLTEESDFSRLADLVPADHAQYWQLTHAFLRIASEFWPRHVADRSMIEPMRRRSELIDRFARSITGRDLAGPIIAAGSTASVPATRRLLAAIARHPQGAVVLPGLDRMLDRESFMAIRPRSDDDGTPAARFRGEPGHPQFGLKAFLDDLGIDRDEVPTLGGPQSPIELAREAAIAETFRPAGTTEKWQLHLDRTDRQAEAEAFAGHGFIVAAHEAEESLAIAIALRQMVEEPGRTAALVTPHPPLARRVAADLRRFGIKVEVAAGVALEATAAGIVARLALDVALSGYEPVALTSLLAHPMVMIGLPRQSVREAGLLLENRLLRGPRLAPGAAALADGAATIGTTIGMADDATPESVSTLVRALADALRPLEELAPGAVTDLRTMAAAHARVVSALVAGPDGRPPTGDDLDALDRFFADIAAAGAGDFPIRPDDYRQLFRALAQGITVRGLTPEGLNIRILGPLDARLQHFDLVVLGGLDEGIWPAVPSTDAWLSRPMRAGLGLEPPERRLGLAAHDLSQHLLAPRVLISRALKRTGTPTVPSRWWQRLQTVLGPALVAGLEASGERYLALARALDVSPRRRRLDRPAPVPAQELRPKRLSVTEIETLIRDPYAIYARRILGLSPLSPLGRVPDHAERGTVIHEALARFAATWRGGSEMEALAALLAAGREAFRRIAAYPLAHALWWPRFEAIAQFVAGDFERGRQDATRHVEQAGEWLVAVDGEAFRLTGRADRIDILGDGTVDLIDFKTGRPPSEQQIATMMKPQMPLEAAMMHDGAFVAVGRRLPHRLIHVQLKGTDGADRIEVFPGPRAGRTLQEVTLDARDRLVELIRRYRDPRVGYPSRIAMERLGSHGDYDHLARVGEWSTSGGGGEEDEA